LFYYYFSFIVIFIQLDVSDPCDHIYMNMRVQGTDSDIVMHGQKCPISFDDNSQILLLIR
jgi:hypothetical protein